MNSRFLFSSSFSLSLLARYWCFSGLSSSNFAASNEWSTQLIPSGPQLRSVFATILDSGSLPWVLESVDFERLSPTSQQYPSSTCGKTSVNHLLRVYLAREVLAHHPRHFLLPRVRNISCHGYYSLADEEIRPTCVFTFPHRRPRDCGYDIPDFKVHGGFSENLAIREKVAVGEGWLHRSPAVKWI